MIKEDIKLFPGLYPCDKRHVIVCVKFDNGPFDRPHLYWVIGREAGRRKENHWRYYSGYEKDSWTKKKFASHLDCTKRAWKILDQWGVSSDNVIGVGYNIKEKIYHEIFDCEQTKAM